MSKESALAKFAPAHQTTTPGNNPPAAQPAAAAPAKSPGLIAAEAAAEAHTTQQGAQAQGGQDPAQAQGGQPPTDDQRMGALLKKETNLVRQQDAFNKEREKFETEKRELLERTGRADKLLDKGKQFDELMAKNDAMSALKLIGFSDTQIFDIMARAGQPVEKTAEQIAREAAQAEIQKDRELREKETNEAQAKQNGELITKFRGQIDESVKASAEKYPFVHYGDSAASEQIFLNIEERIKAPDYKTIPLKQLIDEAMADLEEMYAYDYEQKATIKSKRQQPQGQQEQQPQTAAQAPAQNVPLQNAKPKTLTNQVGVRATTSAAPFETREAKRARLERVLATGDTNLLKA